MMHRITNEVNLSKAPCGFLAAATVPKSAPPSMQTDKTIWLMRLNDETNHLFAMVEGIRSANAEEQAVKGKVYRTAAHHRFSSPLFLSAVHPQHKLVKENPSSRQLKIQSSPSKLDPRQYSFISEANATLHHQSDHP